MSDIARRTWVAITAAAVSVVALWGAGCAPLNASTAIREAEAYLEKAEKAGADRGAPYEYYLARSYLIKAKTTEGYSEFGIAEQYGLRAKDMAVKAMAESRENLLRQKILNERLRQRQGGAP